MDIPKPKRHCEVSYEGAAFDPNKYDEENFKSHRYMANPKKGFWDTIRKIFKKGRESA